MSGCMYVIQKARHKDHVHHITPYFDCAVPLVGDAGACLCVAWCDSLSLCEHYGEPCWSSIEIVRAYRTTFDVQPRQAEPSTGVCPR